MTYTPQLDYADDVLEAVAGVVTDSLAKAITISAKAERNDRPPTPLQADAIAAPAAKAQQFDGREREIKEAVRSLTKKLVRKRIVDEGLRIDGRGLADLRPLVGRGRRAADGPRLRPVPAWRDPGA